MNKKDITDVMICPNCHSDDCYSYSTDEIEFNEDGTGRYIVDCHCNICNSGYRLYMDFTYNITNHYIRGGK